MGKYDNLICTKLYKRENLPGPTPEQRDELAKEGLRISMEHVLWIDSDVIPGAYYGESTWIWPPSYPHQISYADLAKRYPKNQKPMFPHDHNFPELLSWWGTDPDHPENTGSMGMLMDDEDIPLDGSWVAYVPAHMKHMPTRGTGKKVAAIPVCHWTSGPGGMYDREKEGEEAKKQQQESMPANIKKTGPFKYEKYIVNSYKKNVKRPSFMRDTDPQYMRGVAYIDNDVIPDAEFGCDTQWLLPGDKSPKGQQMMVEHSVPHGTSFTFTAMNYDDITDLCAEVEFWIGGEKHIINKSFGAYIPPDVKQGPLIIRNIKKQIFFMMSYPIGAGVKKYSGK
jgi:hypothetical protein